MTSLSGLVSSYKPAMMKFDGSTGYYSKTYTSAGNKVTVVARFNLSTFTGAGLQGICSFEDSSGDDRPNIFAVASDHASTSDRDKLNVTVKNSAGTNICKFATTTGFLDGENHTLFFSFDGDNGLATFYIDGANADDITYAGRVAPTVGTLGSGASSTSEVGSAAGNKCNGQVGFFGHREAYLTNWQDFMHDNGTPKPLDEVSWTEWGGQPLFWNAYGDMENNLGSAGAMNKNGFITVGYGDPVVERVPPYNPAMMEFDGSTGFYNKFNVTPSGNKVSGVMRFQVNSVTGASTQQLLFQIFGTYTRISLGIRSSNYTTADQRSKVYLNASNSSGTQICFIFSETAVDDNIEHTIFYTFDADLGKALLIIDGVSHDDTGVADRVAPTTGTLDSSVAEIRIGGSGSADRWVNGKLGYFGYADTYLTNWQDFMDGDGNPRNIEHDLSTVWGGTPLFWNATGYMQDNKGSAGNMERVGNVVVADNDQTPLIPTYNPAMMRYTGSSYYRKTGMAVSGNKLSFVGRIKVPEFAGTDYQTVYHAADATHRYMLRIWGSGSSLANKMTLMVYNSSVSIVCSIVSTIDIADDQYHTFLLSYDGDNGLATFIVDGQDVDNTGYGGRIVTTGTLETGLFIVAMGRAYNSATQFLIGDMGYIGIADAYLTNWQDFMDSDGNPKPIDETTWTEFGGQPLWWNEHGDLMNNLGSIAVPVNTGVVVGKGGN